MSPNTLTTPLQVDDLTVGYDGRPILHNLSVSITEGTCVALTGQNGSGKSTLLKAILGSAPLNSGTISLWGHQIAPERNRRELPWSKVGYVPQRTSDGGGVAASVKEVVETGLLQPGILWYRRKNRTRVDEALETVNLLHRKNDAFQLLSGGQKQRALIARALIRRPDLLLMDEPLTGLDSHNRLMLAELIANHKQRGGTAIIVLHELGELEPLIDRELRIAGGHIVHDGPCTHHHHDDLSDPHHIDNRDRLFEGQEI